MTIITPQIGPPHLFGDEPKLFERVVRSGFRRYQEWGMGGSTLAAVRAGIETIVTTDSDRAWVEAVRQHEEIAPRITRGDMSVLHGNIGATRDWGNPADRSEIQRWPEYLAAPWAEWARRDTLPEVIFVDGRFRVACCFSVELAFAGCSGDHLPLLMMHDVSEERPSYWDGLAGFDVIEKTESLVLARLRPARAPASTFAKLMRRQFDQG